MADTQQFPTFEAYKQAHPTLANMYNDSLLHMFYNQHIDWMKANPPTPPPPPPPETPGGGPMAILGVGAAVVGAVSQALGFFKGNGGTAAGSQAIAPAAAPISNVALAQARLQLAQHELAIKQAEQALNRGPHYFDSMFSSSGVNNAADNVLKANKALLEAENKAVEAAQWQANFDAGIQQDMPGITKDVNEMVAKVNSNPAINPNLATRVQNRITGWLGFDTQKAELSNWGKAGWGAVGLASAVGLFHAASEIGHGSLGHRAGALVEGITSSKYLVTSLKTLFGLSNPMTLVVLAAVVIAGLLMPKALSKLGSWIGKHIFGKKDDAASSTEPSTDEVPTTVFTTAPVVMIMTGVAMAFMGVTNLNTVAAFQKIDVPETAILDPNIKAGIGSGSLVGATDINGKQVAAEARKDVFVYQGDADGHTDTRVMYFVPGTNGNLTAKIFTLPSKVTFAKPDAAHDIPYLPLFDSNGNVSGSAVQALDSQGAMLRAAGSMDPTKSWDALNAANGQPHTTTGQ